MTVIHNMIQEVLVEAIKKHRKISTEEILTNKEIDFGKFKSELGKSILTGEEIKQMPDINFGQTFQKKMISQKHGSYLLLKSQYRLEERTRKM
jgi:hypothetical protein